MSDVAGAPFETSALARLETEFFAESVAEELGLLVLALLAALGDTAGEEDEVRGEAFALELLGLGEQRRQRLASFPALIGGEVEIGEVEPADGLGDRSHSATYGR